MQVHKLLVPRTARYVTMGHLTERTKNVIFACHGYAQLATDLARQLSPLLEDQTMIIAPEGLSRFYKKGFGGDVGATWMTREEREDEIADYVRYLQTLYDSFREQITHKVNFILLGFSQGCATICRWLVYEKPPFDYLLLCSGSLPHDVDFSGAASYFKDKKIYWLIGQDDPFVTEEIRNEQREFTRSGKLPIHLVAFSGGHVVDIPTVRHILESWDEPLPTE